MEEKLRRPKDEEVKIEWTPLHKVMLVVPLLAIWIPFLFLCYVNYGSELTAKVLTLTGLNVDIIGVVIASLKTPVYGIFADGGSLQAKQAEVEKKYFQRGMLLIAFGLFLQALGSII